MGPDFPRKPHCANDDSYSAPVAKHSPEAFVGNREGALSCRCKQLNLFTSGVFVHASLSTLTARNGKNKTKQQQQATLLTLYTKTGPVDYTHVENAVPRSPTPGHIIKSNYMGLAGCSNTRKHPAPVGTNTHRGPLHKFKACEAHQKAKRRENLERGGAQLTNLFTTNSFKQCAGLRLVGSDAAESFPHSGRDNAFNPFFVQSHSLPCFLMFFCDKIRTLIPFE